MAFHLHRNGQSIPFDLMLLREMARKGDLAQDEYIYDDKKGEWIGAAQVPEMHGAWNIQENEATVAMELPPDFGAIFDEMEAKKAAAAAAAMAPAPVAPAPAPRAPAPREPAPREPARPEPRQEPVRAAAVNHRPMQEERKSAPESRGGGGGGGGGGFGNRGGGRGGNLQPGDILNPITVVILAMVTCGIYPIIWMFKRTDEINTFLGREEINKTHLIIGLFCFPLILMAIWKLIQALPEMGKKAGVQVEDRAAMLMVCALCMAPAFYYLVQTDLNTIWEASGAKPKN